MQKMISELVHDAIAAATEREAAVKSGRDTRKSWADPSSFTEIVGVDFGGGAMHCHFLRAGFDKTGIPLAKAADYLALLSRSTLVVGERAHLAVPQTSRSLAQPFTKEQLLSLYERCDSAGVTLRLFPHAHSRKAREWAAANAPSGFVDSEKSTDINDARAIAFYVNHCNGISLECPPRDFARTNSRQYGHAVREQSNVVLSAVKVHGYRGNVFPGIMQFGERLQNRICGPLTFMHGKSCISVASLVVGERDGEMCRFTYNGRVPGVNLWMRDVLRSSPNHRRGGIARANLFRDRWRPFFAQYAFARGVIVKDGSKYTPYGLFTEEQDRIRRAAWKSVRSEIKNAYQIAAEMSADFPLWEVLDCPSLRGAE